MEITMNSVPVILLMMEVGLILGAYTLTKLLTR